MSTTSLSAPAPPGRLSRIATGPALVALAIAAFLLVFLVVPVASVMHGAFSTGDGGFTLSHFATFFQISLLRESFWNSLGVSLLSVFFASLIAVPLAYLTSRFEFRGALLIQTLGVIPLIMPPFVGAVAMQLIFGRSGTVNLLLGDWFDISIPVMDGLVGVVFVESIHYFPFILMNLVVALRNIDPAMEESAINLGARGMRLFFRVTFPLALPGYIGGAALVFIKVFDDLGTPLVLGATNMLAPQAYLRITSVGLDDPMGYVVSLIMVLFSMLALWLSVRFLKNKDFATLQKGSSGGRQRRLGPIAATMAYGWIVIVLLIVLSPHIGLLLLSFGKVWSFSLVPDGITLDHYQAVFTDARGMIGNTLLYCGIAATLDVVLGGAIAYLILRTRLPGRQLLDYTASAALAVPGVVLAIGYLRTFRGLEIPFTDTTLISTWIIIVIAYAVRRLPYALRSCFGALQQLHISLEDAAENLGANKSRTIRRVVLPLMSGGILAGFVASFITAAVELSATILLATTQTDAPLSYGIYVYMQSAAGRGPGAALGVVAVVVVAIGTYVSHRFIARHSDAMRPAAPRIDP